MKKSVYKVDVKLALSLYQNDVLCLKKNEMAILRTKIHGESNVWSTSQW